MKINRKPGSKAGLNNWDIMAPHASIMLREEHVDSPYIREARKVPGVKVKDLSLIVPGNAFEIVCRYAEPILADLQGRWVVPPPASVSWEDVETALRSRGEVRPFVLDGFLTDYQKDAIRFGWTRMGVSYWHPTGSGKTVTGLLSCLSVDGPLLVITRAASRLQFAREIRRFTHLEPFVIRPKSDQKKVVTVGGETWRQFFRRVMPEVGSAKEVARLWKEAKEKHGEKVEQESGLSDYLKECKEKGVRPVVITGWESLKLYKEELLAIPVGALLLDEAHRGKNSKRWDVLPLGPLPQDFKLRREQERKERTEARKFGGFIKEDYEGNRKAFIPSDNNAAIAARLARIAKKRVCTTATPIRDRVRDLWAQLDYAEPNAWGSKVAWENRYCDRKPGKYGGYDNRGSSNLDELKDRLVFSAHILSQEETHASLPAKRRQSLYLGVEDQCKPSEGFAEELRKAMSRGATAVLEAKLAESASRKREAVLGLIEDHAASDHKVVVFTGRRRDCERLAESIRKSTFAKSKGFPVWSVHGGTGDQDIRDSVVQEYMAHPGPCVLVATGQSVGESLNLQDTDAALFVMLPYTPGQLRQWEGRFFRLGGTRPVVIYYVICEGTVDERIASILIDKLPAVETISEDKDLAAAATPLAGLDIEEEDDESFAKAVLDFIE